MRFDTAKVDKKGRPLGWPLAFMEMLVDPMLCSWVPGWVVEQYERWNPYFRPCLRNALRRHKVRFDKEARQHVAVVDKDSGLSVANPHLVGDDCTNRRLLWAVRQRMIFRRERHKDDCGRSHRHWSEKSRKVGSLLGSDR